MPSKFHSPVTDRIPWDGEWRDSDQLDNRDMREPKVLGHRLEKIRDSEELKGKYTLSQVYDYFIDA